MEKTNQTKAPTTKADDYTEDKNSGSAYKTTLMILLIGLVFHAISGVLVKVANFGPVISAFMRIFISVAVTIPFAYYEIKKKRTINKKGFWLSVAGGLFLGLDFMFFNYSIFYVGSGIAMVLLNIQVIMLPLLYLLFDKDKPGNIYYVLVPFMVLGLIMTGGIFDAGTAVEGAPDSIYGWDLSTLGTLLGAASGTCYGFYLYFTRKAGTMNPGLELQPMFYAFIAQLIPTGLALLTNVSGRGFDLANGVLLNGALPANPETAMGDPIDTMNWVWMVVLGIGGQAICWTFIQYGSVRLKPTNVAALLLLSPVASLFVGYFWVDEVPSTYQLIGVAVVLVAVSLQNGVHKLILGKGKKKAKNEVK